MPKQGVIKLYCRTLFLIILFLCIIIPARCRADNTARVSIDVTAPERLTVNTGKSIIMDTREIINRISLADPEVADVLILTPTQIYITGKAPGNTRLTLWSNPEKVLAVYDLEVVPDIMLIKEKIHTILPAEEDIRITATYDSITLAGTVSSTSNLSEVLAMAGSYAPKDNKGNPMINNLLEVGGVQQVMLEVQVSEISRSLIKKIGFNFNVVNSTGREFGVSILDNLTNIETLQDFPVQQPLKMTNEILTTVSRTEAFPVKPLGVSSSINMIFRFLQGGDNWTVLLAALKDQGLIKVLAEPTLITLSGKPADFLAGGEFPYPIPQFGDVITVEWKSFGVALKFTPTVLDNEKISMEVVPEVSEIDFSNSVAFAGFIIPALSVRRVSTVIELNDGQSFAIAGLLREDIREFVRKFPLFGNIPVLGSLFRSSSFIKNETELVIIVTPHLVKPIDKRKQTLPTDAFVEPDDFEFYLLGEMEGRKGGPPSGSPALSAEINNETGLEGNIGHILP